MIYLRRNQVFKFYDKIRSDLEAFQEAKLEYQQNQGVSWEDLKYQSSNPSKF
ncbi:hypothetical protein PL11201_300061 [Planktothrix sp. PCC 11201]|nr:hypothetical protein PL11201_300061 [Planktothrix sp. PCC 11201]